MINQPIKEGKFNLVCGAFTGYDLDVIYHVDVKL